MQRILLLALGLMGLASLGAQPTPEELFAEPPHTAAPGVWWHWMGSQVSKAGIIKDLDYFKEMGIGYATVFGMADSVEPWAVPVAGGPFPKLVAFTPEWWRLVRFAAEEARKRGIELGIHNCPGYTSTGGNWIPSRLAMRELVFNVSPTNEVPLRARAAFPIWDVKREKFGFPDIPERRSDMVDIAVVDGIRISHVPMGAYVQPAQVEAWGLECDKMNPEAVDFHLNHVIADLQQYVGEELGKGLTYVLLDSYEAGTPSWTPNMAEEFKRRKGYDPIPLLPVLGGYKLTDADTAKRFKDDFAEVRKQLYHEVLFKRMRARLAEVGLKFECEPYYGPFAVTDGVSAVDRPMFEFWYRQNPGPATDGFGFNRMVGPDGQRQNVIEAEAFTGQPQNTAWTEKLSSLKPIGDIYFQSGVNRFFLHSNPLQPYGDDIRPGMTMGRWGTHFGRTQTWAKPAKAWFDYLRRCQALLQWGELSDAKLPLVDPLRDLARTDGKRTLHFIVNMSDRAVALPRELGGKWFDPVKGSVERSPDRLYPRQSGFLELDGSEVEVKAELKLAELVAKDGWRLTMGERELALPTLIDLSQHEDHEVRCFSGTCVYRTCFDVVDGLSEKVLDLGETLGNVCEVLVNGHNLGVVWTSPWRVVITQKCLRPLNNELEIRYTNTWANRLIGDEQEVEDCQWLKATHGGWYPKCWPEWLAQGMAARPSKGRKAWCAWKHYDKNSKLPRFGLLGPVGLGSQK